MKTTNIISTAIIALMASSSIQVTEAALPGCPSNMFSYWSLDDQANPGLDNYGSHNGQVQNGATWIANGQVGGAIHFELNNQRVSIGDVRPISTSASGGVTYAFWGKPAQTSNSEPITQVFMSKSFAYADKQGDLFCSLDYNQSEYTTRTLEVRSIIRGAGWEPSFFWATAVTGDPSIYHHVACTYDSDRLRVYFDGQLVNTADVSNNLTDTANNNPLTFGTHAGDDLQNHGDMDEVAVFNRALTQQEIKKMYNNGLANLGYCGVAVSIDVKPGSFPNTVNPRNNGVIPVGILTTTAVNNTNAFDAATVDPNTLLFGRTGIEASAVHSAIEDVNKDGYPDMISQFRTQNTDIQCRTKSVILTGKTFDGTPIKGIDALSTVGCK